jgi:hypothetical protein
MEEDNFYSTFPAASGFEAAAIPAAAADQAMKITVDDEKDDDLLGPIIETPFRTRCYTWPRHLHGLSQKLPFHH